MDNVDDSLVLSYFLYATSVTGPAAGFDNALVKCTNFIAENMYLIIIDTYFIRNHQIFVCN